MSRIELRNASTLPPYLRAMHDGAPEHDWSTRRCARAFAAHPELLRSYLTFYYPFHRGEGDSVLEPRIKELVRLRIATLNGCQTCKAARLDPEGVSEREAASGVDDPGKSGFSPRERSALAFAEMMARDHFQFDDRYAAEMRRYFNEAELLELMMMCGQYIGFGRMLAMLQLETESCPI